MLANILSILRIILGVSFIFIANNKLLALTFLLLAGLTDLLDGFFARKYKKNKYGQLIDAFADRVLAVFVVISLVIYYKLNILYGFLMLTRDITNGLIIPIIYILKRKKKLPRISKLSKITTSILVISFVSIILDFYSKIFIFVAITISILAALRSLKLYLSNF